MHDLLTDYDGDKLQVAPSRSKDDPAILFIHNETGAHGVILPTDPREQMELLTSLAGAMGIEFEAGWV